MFILFVGKTEQAIFAVVVSLVIKKNNVVMEIM